MKNQDPKSKLLSRRQALVGLGAASATALSCKRGYTPPEDDPFSRSREKPPVPGSDKFATFEERWGKSTCDQCPAACGIHVRVVEGRAVRIEGNPHNPVNQGGIGPRGLSGLQVLYDPDRLPGPMVREGGQLRAASWDEALSAAASALEQLRSTEPDKLLVLSGRDRGITHELLARFCRAFGSPNFVDGRPSRSSAIAQAMEHALGEFEVPAYDWANARCALSLEAGLYEDSCQAVYLARVAAERGRGRRLRLLHAGPAFDLSSYNANSWLRITPGTSGALALALCHVLVSAGTYDHQAAAQIADFEALKRSLAERSPEWAQDIVGLPAAEIRRVAGELWEQRPSFAVVDDRSVSFSNGIDVVQSSLVLNALLGAIEAPGGLRVAARPPLRSWPEAELDSIATAGLSKARLDRAGTSDYPHARSVHDTLPAAISSGGAKVAFLYYANPTYARAQNRAWKQALSKLDAIVSFSPFLDDTTAAVATVVLPDHTYLERYDAALPEPALARAVVGLRQPIVEPLHDTRSTGDVVIELARRVGGAVASALPWATYRDAVDQRLLGLFDAQQGSVRAATEHGFLAQLRREGYWAAPADPVPKSGPITLSTSWKPPEWKGDETSFPLKLIVYRPLGYAIGSGANQPWLHTLRPRPGSRPWHQFARVHPSSAGLVPDGHVARLTTEWGHIEVPLIHDSRVAPGYAFVPMGGGHTDYGRFAQAGTNAMDLVAPGPAPVSGADVLCGTRVRLERSEGHG